MTLIGAGALVKTAKLVSADAFVKTTLVSAGAPVKTTIIFSAGALVTHIIWLLRKFYQLITPLSSNLINSCCSVLNSLSSAPCKAAIFVINQFYITKYVLLDNNDCNIDEMHGRTIGPISCMIY